MKFFTSEKESVDQKRERIYAARRDALERMAKTVAEPEALKRRDEFSALVRADALADIEGFEFSCDRHGSFLTLRSTRAGNIDEGRNAWGMGYPKKLSTSVNLANVKSVSLVDGTPADDDGELTYYMQHENGPFDGAEPLETEFYRSGGEPLKWGLHYYAVVPGFPSSSVGYRSHFYLQPPAPEQSYGVSYGGDQESIKHKTRFPRFAVDDRIVFAGIGATLYVPHTKGQEVLDRILAVM